LVIHEFALKHTHTPAANGGCCREARHRAKLAALMQEWGFKDEATAEAFLRRQQRVTQARRRGSLNSRRVAPWHLAEHARVL